MVFGCRFVGMYGTDKRTHDDWRRFDFYHLLFPIYNPQRSGMANNHWKSFYNAATHSTNKYAIVDQQQGNDGGPFCPTNAEELVNFDEIVAHNSNENIHDCWFDDKGDLYDTIIADTMSHSQLIDLGSNFNLNNNGKENKCGEGGHNPFAKYWLVWDVMVYNMNLLVKKAPLT